MQETSVAEKKFAVQQQEMLLPQVKNISVSRIQALHPNIMFPNLATMKTVLTRLQCYSFKRSTMADHELQGQELRVVLYDFLWM